MTLHTFPEDVNLYPVMAIQAARVSYLRSGYDAIPLLPQSKLPLARNWQNKRTSQQWHKAPNDVNIGIRTGGGKAVIDADDKNKRGTFENVVNLLEGLGYSKDSLPIVQTASDVGRHVYINFSGSMLGSYKHLNKQIGAGEFRFGPGAFVVASPSIVDGSQYRLLQGDFENLPTLDLNDVSKIININEVIEEPKQKQMSHLARAIAGGFIPEKYPSRSEGEAALILSLINSGYVFEEIKVVFDTFPCLGCYAGKGKAKSKWLYATYQNALKFSQRESEDRKVIKSIQDTARVVAWSNASDKSVFLAHTEIAYKAGSLTYAAGSRDLAILAGVLRSTASQATKRQLLKGLLKLEKRAIGLLAPVYSLEVSNLTHSLSTSCEEVVRNGHSENVETHDAFRNTAGLGQRAGQIYQALAVRALTVREICAGTGAARNTVKRALKKMSAVKDRATGEVIAMVTCEGDKWHSNLVDLNLIAAIMSTYGATGKQREQYKQESRDHARSLELGALTKTEVKMNKQKTKKEPMTKEEADRILDTAIRRIMTDENVNYARAFDIFQKRQTGVIEGYRAVVIRTIKK